MEPERVGQPAALERQQADRRIDDLFENFLRAFLRHLFDLDAAFGRGDDGDAARGPVEHHAEVKLALDRQPLLDQEPADFPPLGPGLVRDELPAQKRRRELLRLLGALHDLDPAGLAPAAGVDLRLDDARPAQLARERAGFLGGRRHAPLGHRHAERSQQLFGLVFVDVHRKIILNVEF